MNLDYDQSDSDALQGGLAPGSAVRLPFETPYFFVVNGDKKLAQVGGAQHYGGFAVDRDQLLEAGLGWEPPLTAPPTYCYSSDFFTNNGKQIPAFMTRSVIFALIVSRVSWYIKDQSGQTRRFKDYVPGSRRHGQFLVYLADKTTEKKLVPWGVAVLTASGYQVGNLLKGLGDWKAAVEKILKAEKMNMSPWLFYSAAGTFGDEFRHEMVGPAGAQSSITPLSVQIPKLTGEMLEKLYVGKEIVTHMAQLKAEASDWLRAWENLVGSGAPDAVVQNAPAATFAPPPPPNWWNPVPPEDDIPF
jgi:hypothetical protein